VKLCRKVSLKAMFSLSLFLFTSTYFYHPSKENDKIKVYIRRIIHEQIYFHADTKVCHNC